LLFGLRKIANDITAIVVQTIPFVLLHWSWQQSASKPTPEVFGSIVAGLALGYFAVKTRSCVYGFLTHWAVSATLDIVLLLHVIHR
jgi:membrane protease YdiL (CAAX protease family)